MRIRIKILNDDLKCVDFHSEDLPILVGSIADANICVADPLVDPLHCMIDGNRGSLTVLALSSKSATLLNGERISEAELSSGDCLTLGATCLLVDFAPPQQRGGEYRARAAVGSR